MDRFRLIISELVTNAVRHSPDVPRPIRLLTSVGPDVIRLDVIDGGPGFKPQPVRPRASDQSGWGLFIVDELADRWGLSRHPGAGVWCEIDVEGSALPRRAGGGGGSGALRAA